MTAVRIVTTLHLPEPDPDEELLLEALRARGVDARMAAWDDPAVDWSGGLSVIRSTWNYYHHRDAFVTWAGRAATVGKLLNPADVVRWNTHKAYLLDLQHAGIPTVPTVLVRRGSGERLATILDARRWDRVVVKPAVSAGSFGTRRFTRDEVADGEAHLAALAESGDVLVQPYLSSVEGYGERAVVWIDGELTHAVRKSPRFSADAENVSAALAIADDERELAHAALARAPRGLLYGRVDMARGADGTPAVMELELVEPSLFFRQAPDALARFVDAIARRAASG